MKVTEQQAIHFALYWPNNLSLLQLPPYSPKLNPVEQRWQQLRDRSWLNRCFKHYDEIVDACCQA